VTQTVSRTGSGSTQPASPRLLELIETGELDWDNLRHREAYLRAWVKGSLPPKDEETAPDGDR
jgi:hypothetical protein